MLRLSFAILLMTGFFCARSQEINNTFSYREVGSGRYLRINYENDLAFHTDYYYTQGVHFESVSPRFACKALKVIFPGFGSSEKRYGIGLESAGYTPTTIFADSILYGDRPFAGMAYLRAFVLATDSVRRTRYSAVLSLGLMGPAAGGYEIQAFIHRYTRNADPVGWNYQVGNQIIINYELDYERAVLPPNKYWQLSVTATARAGTLSTKGGAGIVLMGGVFDNPFASARDRSRYTAYLYSHSQVQIVGYDATLQGGIFNAENPYTIPPGDVARVTFRNDFGVVLGWRKWSLSAYGRYLTREFSTGRSHLNGGLYVAVAL